MGSELSPEEKAAELRAEKIAFAIIGAIFATLLGAFLIFGLIGVGLVMVATVPVVYILLGLMAGGKG